MPRIKDQKRLTRTRRIGVLVAYPAASRKRDEWYGKARVFAEGDMPDLARIRKAPGRLKGWSTVGPLPQAEVEQRLRRAAAKFKRENPDVQLRFVRAWQAWE